MHYQDIFHGEFNEINWYCRCWCIFL